MSPSRRCPSRSPVLETDIEPGSTVVCLISGNTAAACPVTGGVGACWSTWASKHYFLVDFPQGRCALHRFLDVLG